MRPRGLLRRVCGVTWQVIASRSIRGNLFKACLVFSVTFPIYAMGERVVASQRLGCHAPYTFPGAGRGDVYDAVMVLNRRHISCGAALHIGAKARALSGLKIIYGPQFGGGGWGGPFHVGSFHCYVLARGSDFINASCRRGRQSLRFYDHRQYFSIPEPGWSPPARQT